MSFDKSTIGFFPRIRILIVWKFQKLLLVLIYLGMQGHLWPQLQASYLPPISQSKCFRFWGILVLITILSVPWNWLVIVQISQDFFFVTESPRFSKAGFPITTKLVSSFKVSIKCLLLEIESLFRKTWKLYSYVGSWWTRVARNCF